jgi:hypothetical protein
MKQMSSNIIMDDFIPKHFPWKDTGMLTFFDNQFSIDNDVVSPLGKPVRIVLERKCV